MIITSRSVKVLLLLLLIPFYGLTQTRYKASGVSMDTVRVEGRVGLEIYFDQLPDQRFVLEIPEIFTLNDSKSGLFNYSNQVWKFTSKGAVLNLEDEQYGYSINLIPVQSKQSVGIKWDMAFVNKTNQSVQDLAAFNCWTMNTAPLFKDVEMERTTVQDSAGNAILLKDVSRTQGDGRRTMQFYPSKHGVDLSKSDWIKQWMVISNQTLNGKKIAVLSNDAKWLFENSVDGDVAYFFNNWEGDHGCVHASPLLAKELQPGKKAKASGVFKFTRKKDR